ncbi:MAG: pyruvate kinase [bacterium]|nr:pyruvate kinase [bacterium]
MEKHMEKRTKIVCTIGPASESVAVLTRMLRAGMDVARLNFSHGTYVHHRTLIRNLRSAAESTKKPLAILQDLQGPKIRIGELPPSGIVLKKGQRVILSTAATTFSILNSQFSIPVQYRQLHRDVSKGDRLLLDDGNLELRVEQVRGRTISATVIVGGRLMSHKGINVPTASLSANPLTAKDLRDLRFGLQQQVDFVALSFVRKASDVARLRRLIQRGMKRGSTPPRIIVKIERREALDHLDEIIEAADGVMVARGDLALEADAASVPIYQKTMIRKCLEAAKPVITATEMLGSMVEKPRPTRAEISDVANAVIDHTDATMLSAESATGKYPVQSVETMAHVIRDTEASPWDDFLTPLAVPADEHPVLAVSAAACRVAKDIGAKALVAVTTTGFTARAIARHHPPIPILAVTGNATVARQLALSWGVLPLLHAKTARDAAFRSLAFHHLRRLKLAHRGDQIVFVAGLQADHAPRWEEAVRIVKL